MFNYIVAALSFLIGLMFTLYSLASVGASLSLGLMFGALLLVNGFLRIWAQLDRNR